MSGTIGTAPALAGSMNPDHATSDSTLGGEVAFKELLAGRHAQSPAQ
jgi:hypothetical protein